MPMLVDMLSSLLSASGGFSPAMPRNRGCALSALCSGISVDGGLLDMSAYAIVDRCWSQQLGNIIKAVIDLINVVWVTSKNKYYGHERRKRQFTY